ncbi:family 16 glycosylhydrolase [Paenibacillus sp. CC-CFT747]|nr:family 16 glycosylhydrolase [Paenibacillus sp. CC-CFT747]
MYGVSTNGRALGVNMPADREFAARLLSNAIDYTGRYLNVDNFFADDPADYLAKNTTDSSSLETYALQEAFYRLLKLEVLKEEPDQSLKPSLKLSREEAVLMLNRFDGQLLSAGPDLRFDWHKTFADEFNGSAFDWSQWSADNYIRFDGISGRWSEYVEQKDGVVRLRTDVDNRLGAPYSSASITSAYRQNYGFYEARYKYPNAYGSHTSYWSINGSNTDFDWNEGTLPDTVGNNVWFIREAKPAPEFGLKNVREVNWSTNDNNAKEFHNFSGYMEPNRFYMAYDNKVSYEVPDYSKYIAPTGKTNGQYPNILSTVVTAFDGNMNVNKIDGTVAEFDWVRNYLKTADSDPASPYAAFPRF